MTTITIVRGEKAAIPFSITDAANGLAGKRVTWAVSPSVDKAPILVKASLMPGSSAAVTIDSQTAGAVSGNINLVPDDFDLLPLTSYSASLWVDSGAGDDRCATSGGFDILRIVSSVVRE